MTNAIHRGKSLAVIDNGEDRQIASILRCIKYLREKVL